MSQRVKKKKKKKISVISNEQSTQKEKTIKQNEDINIVKTKPKLNKSAKKEIGLTQEEIERNEILKIFKKKRPQLSIEEQNEIEEKKLLRKQKQEETIKKIKTFAKEKWLLFKKVWAKFGLLIIFVSLILMTTLNISFHFLGGKLFKGYDDYQKYEIRLNETFDRSGSYYVYMYSNSCAVCSSIKRDVFQYLDSEKNSSDGVKLYLLCIDNYDEMAVESGGSLVGITNYKDIKISSVPYMIYVVDGSEVKSEWTTGSEITKQLKNTTIIKNTTD